MIQINVNGNPVTITWKQAAMVTALLVGGFTTGAVFPEYNPLDLFNLSCGE
tara:strand:+ start:160 stop:312 length:153 start_codon:yes stop_codon:yes gene_type:complete